MNWTIIAILSCCGILMGMLAVNGYTQKIELFLWLLFAGITALVVSRNVDSRVFLHGLYIGLTWGICNGFIQCAFFDRYIVNNPALKENFDKITFMPARLFPLITGPVTGLITGLALGGLILFGKKFQ